MRTTETRSLSTASLVVACVVGCAVRTKPAEIMDLEKLRDSPSLLGSERKAFELLVAADDLLLRAREEWDRNDEKRARSDALMGQIKMRTALALIEGERASVHVEELNVQLEQADRDEANVDEDLAGVAEQISIIGQLRVMETNLAGERRALDAAKKQTATERQKLAEQLASEKRHLAALDAIRGADLALKTADTVESSRYAKAKYLVATDMLKQAHKEFDAGRWDEAIVRATLSRDEATGAGEIARPQFEQAELVKNNRARDRALEAAASALPEVTMRIERDEDAQRLVLSLPQIYADKGAMLLPQGATVLDKVADLLGRFPTYQAILGTSPNDGNKAGDFAAVSLARSNATFWALVARGIDPKRMSIGGRKSSEPASAIASPSDRIQSPRVEISILYHIFDS